MKFINKIPSFLRNRYSITALIFLIWLFFFDQNNILGQLEYRMELGKLEDDKAFYQEEIQKTIADLEELKSNPKSLEKFAREKYLMKKDNEELFVIVNEEK